MSTNEKTEDIQENEGESKPAIDWSLFVRQIVEGKK